jgi:hypothetical protein
MTAGRVRRYLAEFRAQQNNFASTLSRKEEHYEGLPGENRSRRRLRFSRMDVGDRGCIGKRVGVETAIDPG